MKLEFLEKKFKKEGEKSINYNEKDFCRTYLFLIKDELETKKYLYVHISAICFSGKNEEGVLREVESDVMNHWFEVKSFNAPIGLYVGLKKSKTIYPKYYCQKLIKRWEELEGKFPRLQEIIPNEDLKSSYMSIEEREELDSVMRKLKCRCQKFLSLQDQIEIDKRIKR